MITAVDCLANTGIDLPLVGGSIAIALVIFGLVVMLRVRGLRGKAALAVVPLLLLAALFSGTPAPAHAASDCPPASTESTSAPISTPTPTPTPTPTSTPSGIAPLFATGEDANVFYLQFYYDCQFIDSGTAFPVASGTAPITYSSDVLPRGISLDPATGAITVNRNEYSEIYGLSEVVVDLTATNIFGSDEVSLTLHLMNIYPAC